VYLNPFPARNLTHTTKSDLKAQEDWDKTMESFWLAGFDVWRAGRVSFGYSEGKRRKQTAR
jgi:hypothetical protein